MFKTISFAFLLILLGGGAAVAQDIEIDRYTINARIDQPANAVEVRASLAVANLGAAKSRFFLYLNKLAKVSAVTIGGASAQFQVADFNRVPTLSQLTVSTAAPIAANAKATIEVSYRIEAPDSSSLIAITPGEVLLSPDSVWVPTLSTNYAIYGALTAPYTLTVTGGALRAASAGVFKGDAGNATFEQSLNSIPLLVTGAYDEPLVHEQGGVKIEIYAPAGLQSADGKSAKENLTRLAQETGRIADFLSKTMGAPAAGATFRIISSSRAGNLVVPGALILRDTVLRRETLSANTLEILADAVARLWTDGRVRLRGQPARAAQAGSPAQAAMSFALLRDSLPRYLAALYIEDAYGKDAGGEAFARMRWDYTPVAQSGRDAQLAAQTQVNVSYTVATTTKGPLVFRLFAETLGRDKLFAALRSLFTGEPTKVVTAHDLRQALGKGAPEGFASLFSQWVDNIIEPDIVIGIPLPTDNPNIQRVNIRNLGTGDVPVSILAVTASGKQLRASVLVPSENITSFELPTAEKISSVELDPEKLIIQSRYDNDAQPARAAAQTLFNDSLAAFNKGDYATAESKLKEAARHSPHHSSIRAWLARALAAQNKADEAAKEATAALAITPPTTTALAWSRIVLGQLALARNQSAEAATHLRRAVVDADEAPAQLAAREALIKADPTKEAPDAVRAFVTQLDALIKQPSSEKFYTIMIKSNLKRFATGLTVTPPTSWTTAVLRVETIDASRLALDVQITAKAGGRDQAGTALFILYRAPAGWMLEDVEQFNVK